MNFDLPDDLAKLKADVDAFVRAEVITVDNDPRWTPHGPPDEMRRDLNEKARSAGRLAVRVPEEYGG